MSLGFCFCVLVFMILQVEFHNTVKKLKSKYELLIQTYVLFPYIQIYFFNFAAHNTVCCYSDKKEETSDSNIYHLQLSNIVKFGIQFVLLLSIIAWLAVKGGNFHFGLSWLLIPVLVLLMAGLGLGLGIIISSLTTKYRDFTVLIGFAVQLLMYATPIVYPLSFLKDKSYAAWIAWNPLTPIVEAFRFALFGIGTVNTQGLL